MTIITLTSDFGLVDGYVGTMKGVILGIVPDARLIDVSHDISPQAVAQAAYVLGRAAPYFPSGTIHLAVVDPGVGSARRPIIVTTRDAFFVGPDNGVFTFALDEPGAQAWLIDRPGYWLPHVSRTFHGRDVFAPVAAHLARGAEPNELASPLADPVRLVILTPQRRADGIIEGGVVYVDRFGNLITNVPGDWLVPGRWYCEIGGQLIPGPYETYAAVEPGALVLLVSSSGAAEVAVRDGNAAERLGVREGSVLRLRPIEK